MVSFNHFSQLIFEPLFLFRKGIQVEELEYLLLRFFFLSGKQLKIIWAKPDIPLLPLIHWDLSLATLLQVDIQIYVL